jgi:hypothetical protein
MVLTAIPTAINGRLGMSAGVHCRTDSLRVRISGHRPTAADATPVTYNQMHDELSWLLLGLTEADLAGTAFR